MDQLIAYFSHIPSSHRSAILFGGIAFFWLLENAFPLIQMRYNQWKHAGVNLFYTGTTIVINFLLAFLLVATAVWCETNQVGLLYFFPVLPTWGFALLGLLLLDLIGAYLVHWVEHQIPLFWRMHLIHHSDKWVDTTTANRHHPGESVLRFVFTCLGIVAVGAPMWLVLLYQTCSVVATQFNHANIKFPEKFDYFLSYVIVSPNMHKVHHHYMLPHTDSNFGNIFSVWDRLFVTFSYLPADQIVYGIDTYFDDQQTSSIGELWKIPFSRDFRFKKPTN
jgi:sterol desaturase/sphingolipid hydroxylase (fatty acid hydroxylase superfamily)